MRSIIAICGIAIVKILYGDTLFTIGTFWTDYGISIASSFDSSHIFVLGQTGSYGGTSSALILKMDTSFNTISYTVLTREYNIIPGGNVVVDTNSIVFLSLCYHALGGYWLNMWRFDTLFVLRDSLRIPVNGVPLSYLMCEVSKKFVVASSIYDNTGDTSTHLFLIDSPFSIVNSKVLPSSFPSFISGIGKESDTSFLLGALYNGLFLARFKNDLSIMNVYSYFLGHNMTIKGIFATPQWIFVCGEGFVFSQDTLNGFAARIESNLSLSPYIEYYPPSNPLHGGTSFSSLFVHNGTAYLFGYTGEFGTQMSLDCYLITFPWNPSFSFTVGTLENEFLSGVVRIGEWVFVVGTTYGGHSPNIPDILIGKYNIYNPKVPSSHYTSLPFYEIPADTGWVYNSTPSLYIPENTNNLSHRYYFTVEGKLIYPHEKHMYPPYFIYSPVSRVLWLKMRGIEGNK